MRISKVLVAAILFLKCGIALADEWVFVSNADYSGGYCYSRIEEMCSLTGAQRYQVVSQRETLSDGRIKVTQTAVGAVDIDGHPVTKVSYIEPKYSGPLYAYYDHEQLFAIDVKAEYPVLVDVPSVVEAGSKHYFVAKTYARHEDRRYAGDNGGWVDLSGYAYDNTKNATMTWKAESAPETSVKVVGCSYYESIPTDQKFERYAVEVKFGNYAKKTVVPIVCEMTVGSGSDYVFCGNRYAENWGGYLVGEKMAKAIYEQEVERRKEQGYDEPWPYVKSYRHTYEIHTITHYVTVVPPGYREDLELSYWCSRQNDTTLWHFKCENVDAKIYITTDGSDPSEENGALYSEPFEIADGTLVKAKAFADGDGESEIVSFTVKSGMVIPTAETGYMRFTDDLEGTIVDWSGWSGIANAGTPTTYRIMGQETTSTHFLVRNSGVSDCVVEAKVEDVWYQSCKFSHDWNPLRTMPSESEFLCAGGVADIAVNLEDFNLNVDAKYSGWISVQKKDGGFQLAIKPNSKESQREGDVVISMNPSGDTKWSPRLLHVIQRKVGYFPAPIASHGVESKYVDRVHIFWEMPDVSEFTEEKTQFLIYRSEDELGERTFIGASDYMMYEDFSALPNKTYYYWVVAKSGDLESDPTLITGSRYANGVFGSSELRFSVEGGMEQVEVSAPAEWKLDKCSDWISMDRSDGSGNSVVKLTVPESTNPYSRMGYCLVEFMTSEGWVYDCIRVVQKGLHKDITDVAIIGRESAIEKEDLQFVLRVTYEDGTVFEPDKTQGASFQVEEGPSDVLIDDNGRFYTGSCSEIASARVVGTYTEYGIPNRVFSTVTIYPTPTFSEATDCTMEIEARGEYGWRVDNEESYEGLFSIRTGEPTTAMVPNRLVATVDAGVLSFWCKLSPEFKSLGGIYGQYVLVTVGGRTAKQLFYDDAPDWTQIKLLVPEDGTTVEWSYQYVGSNEPHGVARIDKLRREDIVISDIFIEGKDQFDYVRDMNPAGYVIGYYDCFGHCNGIEDSTVPITNCLWSIKGDNAEITSSNFGASCTVRVKPTGSNEKFSLVATCDSGSGLKTEKVITVAYDFAQALLDYTTLAFEQTGSKGWVGVLSESKIGGSSAKSGPLKRGEDSAVKTTITGHSEVSFWWKSLLPGDENDSFEFLVDGECVLKISGANDWAQEKVEVPVGAHELEWRHSNLSVGDETAYSCVFLDGVNIRQIVDVTSIILSGDNRIAVGESVKLACSAKFDSGVSNAVQPVWTIISSAELATISADGVLTAIGGSGIVVVGAEYTYNSKTVSSTFSVSVNEIAFEDAVGAAGLDFEVDGDWKGCCLVSHDGVASLRSSTLVEKGQHSFSTRVMGPGKLTFWWKSDTWSSSDGLEFSVDGVVLRSAKGVQGWTKESVEIKDFGEHTLKWSAVKTSDAWTDGCQNCGWIDEIEWDEYEKELTAIEIDCPSQAYGNTRVQLKCLATFDGKVKAEVKPIWRVSLDLDHIASLDVENGLLELSDFDNSFTYVLVEATYSHGGVEKSVTSCLTIYPSTSFTPDMTDVMGIVVVGPDVVENGETASYSCYLQMRDGLLSLVDSTWVVTGCDNAQISDDGILSVGDMHGGLSVKATYTIAGKTYENVKSVMVQPRIVSVEIVGTNRVHTLASAQMRCVARYSDGHTAEVDARWISSAPSVASITKYGGLLTANAKRGKVTLQAICQENGGDKYDVNGLLLKATMPVEIYADIVGAMISRGASATLYSYASRQYEFYLMFDNEQTAKMTAVWALEDADGIATINTDGKLTTLDNGGKITVRAYYEDENGLRYSAEIEEEVVERSGVSSIAIKGPQTVQFGQSVQYVCEATCYGGEVKRVAPVWSFSQFEGEGGRACSISEDGLLTVAPIEGGVGTVSVRATYVDEGGASFKVGYYVTLTALQSQIGLAEAVSNQKLTFTTDETDGWFGQTYYHNGGGSAGRTGALKSMKKAWMATTVTGAGTISFYHKFICKNKDSRLLVYIDGAYRPAITCGAELETEWTKTEYVIDSDGEHEIKWDFRAQADGDFMLIDDICWNPIGGAVTATTPVPVEHSWLDAYPSLLAQHGGDYEAVAIAKTGKVDANGKELCVWEDYVAGTDPTDPQSQFKAKIEFVEGRAVVTWEPKLDPEDASKRIYMKYGKVSLSDKDWTPIVSDDNSFRFFKVGVSLK